MTAAETFLCDAARHYINAVVFMDKIAFIQKRYKSAKRLSIVHKVLVQFFYFVIKIIAPRLVSFKFHFQFKIFLNKYVYYICNFILSLYEHFSDFSFYIHMTCVSCSSETAVKTSLFGYKDDM